MAEDSSVTDKLLDRAIEENNEVMEKNNLTPTEKALLNGQSFIFLFIKSDHKKTEVLYDDYKERQKRLKELEHYQRLIVGTVLTTIIILAINGFIWFVKIAPVLDKLTNL